jgi:hypothetical protein
MAEQDSGVFWKNQFGSAMEPPLSPQEKALRDEFVGYYLEDLDYYKAALRVGFNKAYAMQYAQQFEQESYVQQQIMIRSRQAPLNAREQEQIDKAAVMNTLRLLINNGPYAVRATAAAKMASILGMDAPVKSQADITHRGGVMAVPAIASMDEWEKTAQATQERLVSETRE